MVVAAAAVDVVTVAVAAATDAAATAAAAPPAVAAAAATPLPRLAPLLLAPCERALLWIIKEKIIDGNIDFAGRQKITGKNMPHFAISNQCQFHHLQSLTTSRARHLAHKAPVRQSEAQC
jgi:hypothetical protein